MTPSELTAARKALRLSQVELARILGIATNTVNRWEHGSRAIPPYLRWAIIGLAAMQHDYVLMNVLGYVLADTAKTLAPR